MSKLLEGIAGQKAANFNAATAEIQGQQALSDGVAENARLRAEARRTAGEAIAAQGANGLQLGTGSALDLLRESAIEEALDRQSIQRQAMNRNAGLRSEARLQRARGRDALLAGIIGTATDAAKMAAGGG